MSNWLDVGLERMQKQNNGELLDRPESETQTMLLAGIGETLREIKNHYTTESISVDEMRIFLEDNDFDSCWNPEDFAAKLVEAFDIRRRD
jgi:hypothetical protein